jgi:hypothetical protein
MFRALLAHPQEACTAALGILCACYVSWLHHVHFNDTFSASQIMELQKFYVFYIKFVLLLFK